MGALVGGLYATGMSAAELEALVESIDWVSELADSPHRKDMNFRRKEDDEQYPINVELGLADGELKVPMGIVHGHRLELLLHERARTSTRIVAPRTDHRRCKNRAL
jgi:NTE family protein